MTPPQLCEGLHLSLSQGNGALLYFVKSRSVEVKLYSDRVRTGPSSNCQHVVYCI